MFHGMCETSVKHLKNRLKNAACYVKIIKIYYKAV